MTKVVVFLQGGVLVGARSTDPNVELQLVDFDDEDEEKHDKAEERYEECQTEYPYGIY